VRQRGELSFNNIHMKHSAMALVNGVPISDAMPNSLGGYHAEMALIMFLWAMWSSKYCEGLDDLSRAIKNPQCIKRAARAEAAGVPWSAGVATNEERLHPWVL